MTAGPTTPGVGYLVDLSGLRAGNGGVMVGRQDGRVVFVRGALPDERVRVRIDDDRRSSYLTATVVDVLDASPHRVPDRCPAAAAGAGCCDLAHADDTVATDIRATAVRDVLARIGKLPDEVVAGLELQVLEPTSHYRTRVRMPVDDAGVAGNHVRAGSGVVTDTPCAQPIPDLVEAVGARSWTPGAEVVAVLGDDGTVHLAERAPDTGRAGSSRARSQRARSRRPRVTPRTVAGDAHVVRRVRGRRWSVPVSGFWQAHVHGAEAYSALVAQMAEDAAPDATSAWDLYGGAGVFAGSLVDALPSLDHVTVVESDAEAVAAARETFADDGRIACYRGPVGPALGSLPGPDIVVTDPPRSGLGADVVSGIAAARPRVVVHVGCDPAAAARDLGLLTQRGYEVTRVVAVDAFGLTHHVEVVAALVSVD
ncbi:MAG: TRAM domain-containing protein [Gordonia paraffinivorans]